VRSGPSITHGGRRRQGPGVAPVEGGIYPHARDCRGEFRRRLPAVLCRSRSLPPEERKLPDVFAGRHHQRTPREHAGFAHGVLELRKLCELVARLGPNVLSPAGDASKNLRLRGW